MTQDNMITELTDTVKHLKRDVDSLKENNKYLYSKLEKAYDDRITLRAENHKLKNPVNTPIMQESEEEECISCSAQEINMAYTYAKPTKKVKSKMSTKKEDKYNPKAKAKKGRTARGKYTLPRKGFMR